MKQPYVRIYTSRDPLQYEDTREYWKGKSGEERVSAVEELRRQFGKIFPGKAYDSRTRLRRVLRIVQ